MPAPNAAEANGSLPLMMQASLSMAPIEVSVLPTIVDLVESGP